MDINVYLPDDIGERAKAADLPLSRMLRAAVLEELARRDALEESQEGMKPHELEVEDYRTGEKIRARFTGRKLAVGRDGAAYLHRDGRVLWHDHAGGARLDELEDPVEELGDHLEREEYISAVTALGLTPVVDV